MTAMRFLDCLATAAVGLACSPFRSASQPSILVTLAWGAMVLACLLAACVVLPPATHVLDLAARLSGFRRLPRQ